MSRKLRITACLQAAFSPLALEVTDDSAKHAGHSGSAPGGQTHYTVHITAQSFTGLTRVARHQRIYAVLKEEFSSGLHALAIHAKAPGE